jgi:hypothetical protein
VLLRHVLNAEHARESQIEREQQGEYCWTYS